MNFMNDCESKEDLLGYLPYIEAFEYLIKYQNDFMNLPIVFGIHGKWGIGKSTFMELIKSRLDCAGNYFTIKINPWEYANEMNFVSVFLSELFRTCKDSLYNDEKGTDDSIIVFFKTICKPLKMSTNIGPLKAEYDFSKLTFDSQKEMIDKYITENYAIKDTVHEILKADIFKIKKIIVFIDDLDRCPADKVMEVIESIKLILNSENCIFFIGCDKEYLESALSIRYEKFIKFIVGEFDKEKNDEVYSKNYEKSFKNFSNEYLEKIIQVPFYIPPLNENTIENYIEQLLNPQTQKIKNVEMDLSLYDNFKTILNRNLVTKLFIEKNLNPRRMKRILNLIFLNYLFIIFKCGKDFITDTEVNLLIILGVLKDQYSEYNKRYLSSEIMCKRTFKGIYDLLKNKIQNHEDDKESSELFTRYSDINKIFEIFYKESKINSQKKLEQALKNISVLITINNMTTSEKSVEGYWGEIGEIKSTTATGKTLKVFLDRIKNNEKVLDFVLWFFDTIFDEKRYYLGIQTNVLLYRCNGSNSDHINNFILKFHYDEASEALLIKFENGKLQSKIQDLSLLDKVTNYEKGSKTIIIDRQNARNIENIKNAILDLFSLV